jgi:pimeloyl-ACP methyl ester carboxylesterase
VDTRGRQIDSGTLHALRYEGFGYFCREYPHRSPERPVLFVGGAFQSMASWRRFADHFSDRRTVILCDLPGSGTADALPSEYGLDFLAIAMSGVLDHLDVAEVDIVSASYGSPIAYRFAQLFPERTGRLVLAGVMKEIPAGRRAVTAATVAAVCDGRLGDFARLVVEGLMCLDPSRHVERRAVTRRLLQSQLERMTPDDQLRYVHNTTRLLEHQPLDLAAAPPVPALVFTGEHDVYTTPEDCREVASAFADVRFSTIPAADHLFHLERFDTTLALLDAFLDPCAPCLMPAGCSDSRGRGSSDRTWL